MIYIYMAIYHPHWVPPWPERRAARDLGTLPEPPELSLRFAHDDLVSCDMEEAEDGRQRV